MKSAVIVCNGIPPAWERLQEAWEAADLHVAADGGVNALWHLNCFPDVVVGDLDSIDEKIKKHLKEEQIIYLSEQNTHDADKAIRYCLQKNIFKLEIFGADGLRNAQFLANLELLYKYKNYDLRFWTHQERIILVQKKMERNFTFGNFFIALSIF